MTAKEKAKELVGIFYLLNTSDGNYINESLAKQCALICVDEMQEHAQMIETPYEGYSNPYQFLKKVKQEIEKL